MKIASLKAHEILDAHGMPTVECMLILEDDALFTASVAQSCVRSAESHGQTDRLCSMQARKSIDAIEKIIAPSLLGNIPDVVAMDLRMLEFDLTGDKSSVWAQSMLAVSMAVCRAQAYCNDLELYELIAYLTGFDTISLPAPLLGIINGNHVLPLQEIMIIPVGSPSFRSAVEVGVHVLQTLKTSLQTEGQFSGYGEHGGISIPVSSQQALELLKKACDIVSSGGTSMLFAIDAAASRWYHADEKEYLVNDKTLSATEMIAWYQQIGATFPLYLVEDGLASVDWQGWQELSTALNNKVQLVGGDIFATRPERVWQAIEMKLGIGVVIKPSQIGTVTEALQVAKLGKEHNQPIVISHQLGETNDTFIADLAVGISADYIKAGGLVGGQHIAKYNRLLMIEEELLMTC